MINESGDQELEKIKMKKIAEMLQKAQANSIGKTTGEPIVLTDHSFSAELSKHKLMLVDFWAPWCGPCRMVAPIIEHLAAEYAGKVTFGKLNVDENQMAASNFGVMSIPTLLLFKNGQSVQRIVGAVSKSQIESVFKPFMDY